MDAREQKSDENVILPIEETLLTFALTKLMCDFCWNIILYLVALRNVVLLVYLKCLHKC